MKKSNLQSQMCTNSVLSPPVDTAIMPIQHVVPFNLLPLCVWRNIQVSRHEQPLFLPPETKVTKWMSASSKPNRKNVRDPLLQQSNLGIFSFGDSIVFFPQPSVTKQGNELLKKINVKCKQIIWAPLGSIVLYAYFTDVTFPGIGQFQCDK